MESWSFCLAVWLLRVWAALWPFSRRRGAAVALISAACRRGLVQPQWHEAGGRWYWIDLADAVSRAIALDGCFNHAVLDRVLACLPLGGTFVDIGANVGSTTLAAVGRAGRVLAIEPDPRMAVVLRRNLARNMAMGVEVCETACCGRSGALDIYPKGRDGPAVLVRCDRLDSLLSDYGLDRVDLVKIGTGGMELEVLRGMESILDRFHPALAIEMDRGALASYQTEPIEIERLLAGRGYRPGRIDAANWIYRRPDSALIELENSDAHPGSNSRSAPVLQSSGDALEMASDL